MQMLEVLCLDYYVNNWIQLWTIDVIIDVVPVSEGGFAMIGV